MKAQARKAAIAPLRVPTEKLKYPSVIEAICEFRFAAGASYTIVPGAMMERLRSRFPEHETLPTASLMAVVSESIAQMPPVPHHRFKSRNPNALIQTGPRLLTINILPRYPSFEVFRQMILDVLEEYREIANPGNPIRIGLRYINQLVALSSGTSLADYLNVDLDYPKELAHPSKETSIRLVFSHGELGELALASAFPSQTGEGRVGALLDLDFSLTEPRNFNLSRFPQWLDDAHAVVYQAFTSTVRNDLLSRMRG